MAFTPSWSSLVAAFNVAVSCLVVGVSFAICDAAASIISYYELIFCLIHWLIQTTENTYVISTKDHQSLTAEVF